MGLPKLKHVQKERARLANRLYRLTKRFLKMLQLQNIGCQVENPAGSLMWVTDHFVEFMQEFNTDFSGMLFHTCMFGAPHKNRLRFGPTFLSYANSTGYAQATILMLLGG